MNLRRLGVIGLTVACLSSRAEAADFIDLNKPFAPGASIQSTTYGGLSQQGGVDGVAFSLYADGSASFGNAWNVSCTTDAMTDIRMCLAMTKGLFIAFHQRGGWQVGVGGDKYPKSTVMMRIDGGAPLEAPERGWFDAEAVTIVRQLAAAQRIVTRYTDWPNNSNVDAVIDKPNFGPVSRYLEWAVKGQPDSAPAP